MKKIISIDYGSKRCGIAMSDELQMIASPLFTVHAASLIDELSKLLTENQVEGIVVGMPTDLSGKPTDSSQAVANLVRQLRKKFTDCQIWTEDERFTSKLAMQAMVDGNLSRSKRRDKTIVDKLSAAIILQSFLDRRSRENKK